MTTQNSQPLGTPVHKRSYGHGVVKGRHQQRRKSEINSVNASHRHSSSRINIISRMKNQLLPQALTPDAGWWREKMIVLFSDRAISPRSCVISRAWLLSTPVVGPSKSRIDFVESMSSMAIPNRRRSPKQYKIVEQKYKNVVDQWSNDSGIGTCYKG